MPKIYETWHDKFNFPTIILILAITVGVFHLFSYLIPFTDDAFVVANTQPVAADVSGYITKIYVHNGQHVKKGDALFKVFDVPYKLALAKTTAQYESELAHIEVIKQQIKKNRAQLNVAMANFKKKVFEYNLKRQQSVNQAISVLEVKELSYEVDSLRSSVQAIREELIMDKKEIIQARKVANTLKAERDNAAVNLELTTVRAGSKGIVDNMYLSKGTPIKLHQPLFSLINTNNWYVQANFNETDLRYARPGDKVIVILRMYYFQKIFHGKIVNHLWVADRQMTNPRTQQQVVDKQNEWLNLPQRFPLQIKIIDPDPKYPLNPGASAYVYIRTGT